MKLLNTTSALKTVAIAALAAGTALSASATARNDQFTVAFEFLRTAPVAQTYENFRDTARRACRDHASAIRLTAGAYNLERECEAELLNKAVAKTEIADLIRLHKAETRTQN